MKTSIKSYTKLWIDVLQNINIFLFRKQVVKLIWVSFLTAKDLTQPKSSSISIKCFNLLSL